jgi:hypothetical protein
MTKSTMLERLAALSDESLPNQPRRDRDAQPLPRQRLGDISDAAFKEGEHAD